jgi:hypothetical protein
MTFVNTFRQFRDSEKTLFRIALAFPERDCLVSASFARDDAEGTRRVLRINCRSGYHGRNTSCVFYFENWSNVLRIPTILYCSSRAWSLFKYNTCQTNALYSMSLGYNTCNICTSWSNTFRSCRIINRDSFEVKNY